MRRLITSALMLGTLAPVSAAEWQAGAAKLRITPRQSMWMAGYAARTKASEGVAQDLHASALALEDKQRVRTVLLTVDLVRVTRPLCTRVAERIRKRYGIPRERVLVNASHTHSGPVIAEMPSIYHPSSPELDAAMDTYSRELEDKLVEVAGTALRELKPARIGLGRTHATFAKNRRTQFGENGPVDHDVPFLRVDDQRGKLLALMFGYSCHGTTISQGPEFYQFHGDWPGVAKELLEARHPGAVALFLAGFGADANPNPRGPIEIARQHGKEIASAVEAALGGKLKPVRGPLRLAWDEVPLAYAAVPTREELKRQLADNSPLVRRHAEEMFNILDRDGRLPAVYPCPVQIWRFGQDLTLIALGGEVVVDYALRLKKELGADGLWLAGYSNDVFGYLPSLRVLREGGYEGGGAMLYTNHPGPFAPDVEEIIIRKVHDLVDRTRIR